MRYFFDLSDISKMFVTAKKQWLFLFLSGSVFLASAGAVSAQTEPLPLPISFSVDGGAFNPVRTAPGSLNPPNPAEGLQGFILLPNDVWALSPLNPLAIGGGYATEGEIFQSPPDDRSNINRISGALNLSPAPGGLPPFFGPFAPNPGAPVPAPLPPGGPRGKLDLEPNDNIISLSYGMDSGNVLQFSVNPSTTGVFSTAVHVEAVLSGTTGDEAAGDIFKSQRFDELFGGYLFDHIMAGHVLEPADPASNELYRDEAELGLQAPLVEGFPPAEDDLNALEEANVSDPFWGVDFDLIDGIPEKNVFLTLGVSSLLSPASRTPDNIWVKRPDEGLEIYASASRIGLQPGDIIDALALSDLGGVGLPPNGRLDPGDEALFSLRIGSPSLLDGSFSGADVFFTDFTGSFRRYASHMQLGLLFTDELNALDIKPSVLDGGLGPTDMPEPSAVLGLMALGIGAGTVLRRKQKAGKS